MTPLPRARFPRVLICLGLVPFALGLTAILSTATAETPQRDITLALPKDEQVLDLLLRFKLDGGEAQVIAGLIDQALTKTARQSDLIARIKLTDAAPAPELQDLELQIAGGRVLRLHRVGVLQYSIGETGLKPGAADATPRKIAVIPPAPVKPPVKSNDGAKEAEVDAANLQTPIANGRISSPWGMRKHPVLQVMRFHMGVDYEASAGTPVYAASDGVVADARRHGNYGLYLKIAHGDRLATVYAHLQKLAPGLKPGSPVKRGEVVAYVGRTGLASGPHLYFEVFVDEVRVNPEHWVGQANTAKLASVEPGESDPPKPRGSFSLAAPRRPF